MSAGAPPPAWRARRATPAIALAGLMLLPLAFLAGCGVVAGAAATGGVVAMQERGVDSAASDLGIRLEINRRWLAHDLAMHTRLGLQVWEGRVVVGGGVPSRAQRDTALALVRGIPGVREVIDAVEVGRMRDAARFLSDTQIEKEIDLRLLLARDVESINYSVQSVFGTVHLIGTARSRDERVRVGALIRQVGGVRRLVDHVRVRGEARSLRAPAASP